MIRFILSNELFVINRGSNPTFQSTTRNEIIDLTIATQALSERVVDWEVSKDESCSDHNIITFRVCETIDLINHVAGHQPDQLLSHYMREKILHMNFEFIEPKVTRIGY